MNTYLKINSTTMILEDEQIDQHLNYIFGFDYIPDGLMLLNFWISVLIRSALNLVEIKTFVTEVQCLIPRPP
jgi:hypothetical protein